MNDIIPTYDVWWSLFKLFTAVGLVIAGGVTLFYIYTLFRYKSDTTPEDVSLREAATGIRRILIETKPRGVTRVILLLTGVVVFTLIVTTIDETIYLEYTPTEDAFPVWVTGFQFGWEFEYEVDGQTVKTVGYVVLPADTVIELKVTSRDVFHTFGAAEFKVKVDAIPGILNTMWTKTPPEPSVFTAYCYELCGVGHSFMTAKVIVVDKDEFFQAYNAGPEKFKAYIEEVAAKYR